MNARTQPDRIMIAIDPHKASWTAAAIGPLLQPLATIRVPVSRTGYRSLRQFAAQWPDAGWAIEGASGLGAPLASWLAADKITAVDVPAKLATRVRMLSTGHGRKNDDADATSVGIAAMTATGLQTSTVIETVVVLRALVEHRDDVVKTRTQTINRLHVLLTRLIPSGAPRNLDAATAACCCARSDRGTTPFEPYGAWPANSWPRSATSTDALRPRTPRLPKPWKPVAAP